MSFDNLSSLSLMRTSESFSDLNAELSGAAAATTATASASGNNKAPVRSSLASLRSAAAASGGQTVSNNNNNSATAVGNDEFNNNNNNKPFGLGEKAHTLFLYFPFFKKKKYEIDKIFFFIPRHFSDPFVTNAIWVLFNY